MTIVLGNTSLSDLGKLYEIEKECFDEEAFTRNQISDLLTDYNSLSLIAREGDRIVGFIIGLIYPGKKAAGGHVVTLEVVSSHRRRGIGTMLLREIEVVFRVKGVRVSLLEVREDNVAALNLYRKLGYEKIGKLENYYKTAHGICLRKILR